MTVLDLDPVEWSLKYKDKNKTEKQWSMGQKDSVREGQFAM